MGIFKVCALFPAVPGSSRELFTVSALAPYHTQNRCSIMNECICCRINTYSSMFAGTHSHLFLKKKKSQSKKASSEFSLFGWQTQGREQRCVSVNCASGGKSEPAIDSQGQCLNKAATLTSFSKQMWALVSQTNFHIEH